MLRFFIFRFEALGMKDTDSGFPAKFHLICKLFPEGWSRYFSEDAA